MKSTTHTGGVKEFDNTQTADLPYKCKRCGQYIKIENRHRWLHNCFRIVRSGVFERNRDFEVDEGKAVKSDILPWIITITIVLSIIRIILDYVV